MVYVLYIYDIHLEHNIAVLPAASNISLALEVADLILVALIIVSCW